MVIGKLFWSETLVGRWKRITIKTRPNTERVLTRWCSRGRMGRPFGGLAREVECSEARDCERTAWGALKGLPLAA